MIKTIGIQITGQVQGVGFRPFVFSLAQQQKVKGQVSNNEKGVFIIINIDDNGLNKFLFKLFNENPKVSKISSHTTIELKYREFPDFRIVSSEKNQQVNLPLTPDFALCEDCKKDIVDPENRRFKYAFTTCVKCGPRFSITRKFPFERAHTSLADFRMCEECFREYQDPYNRRFHSQTNSCPQCGISLRLVNSNAEEIEKDQIQVIKKAADFIKKGNIVAVKGTNGYLLCCGAMNKEAVNQLRKRKKRPSKPFAVLFPSLEVIEKYFNPTPSEIEALTSTVAPIVILRSGQKSDQLMQFVAPGLNKVGLMLPSSALLQLLMNELKMPVVATSGNMHGSPIISQNIEAEEKLNKVADYFLHHDLQIEFPQDDSVIRFSGNDRVILRRSRGMAPNYLENSGNLQKTVLATGAHLKSTFSFVPNSYTYICQYFGNLDNYEVLQRFSLCIDRFTEVFESLPQIILADNHPQYQSNIKARELAEKWKSEFYEIQHHRAHFAAVLQENDLFNADQKVLGVIWDGTGWGEDKTIWGGEFFMYEKNTITRIDHLEYYPWIAGDKMALEPRLSLLALISEGQKEKVQNKFTKEEWKIYNRLLEKSNLKTSSMGRLFDAVASLLNIIDSTTYEGEAAMLLESCAESYTGSDYIDFSSEIFSGKEILNNILKEVEKNTATEKIAAGFIHTLARFIVKTATDNKVGIIACSGGVFQNVFLLDRLKSLMESKGMILKINRNLSCNDENISFGQLQYFRHFILPCLK